ncbi:MAG: DUF4406 domain-containing protein [Candidatus Limimorpha sp.]
MKRVYLSLPISGYSTKQRMEYADEVRRLLELRYDANNENVIVITLFDVNENEDSYARKMGNDIETLLECDIVCFCYGWQNSKGCMAEFAVAKIYGKEIIFE